MKLQRIVIAGSLWMLVAYAHAQSPRAQLVEQRDAAALQCRSGQVADCHRARLLTAEVALLDLETQLAAGGAAAADQARAASTVRASLAQLREPATATLGNAPAPCQPLAAARIPPIL